MVGSPLVTMEEIVAEAADCRTQTGFGIYLLPPSWTAESRPDRCRLLFSSLPC